jgi:hypothetical protein
VFAHCGLLEARVVSRSRRLSCGPEAPRRGTSAPRPGGEGAAICRWIPTFQAPHPYGQNSEATDMRLSCFMCTTVVGTVPTCDQTQKCVTTARLPRHGACSMDMDCHVMVACVHPSVARAKCSTNVACAAIGRDTPPPQVQVQVQAPVPVPACRRHQYQSAVPALSRP